MTFLSLHSSEPIRGKRNQTYDMNSRAFPIVCCSTRSLVPQDAVHSVLFPSISPLPSTFPS